MLDEGDAWSGSQGPKVFRIFSTHIDAVKTVHVRWVNGPRDRQNGVKHVKHYAGEGI